MKSVIDNPWVRFTARRIVGLVGVLLLLALVAFFAVRLVPGDPAVNFLGPNATTAAVAHVRQELGLNGSIASQLGTYGSRLLRGDLGRSFASAAPVSEIVTQRIGTSLKLAGASLALVLLASFPIGMLAAGATQNGRRRRLDVAFTGATSVVSAVPDYLMATFLAFVFAVELRLLPSSGGATLSSFILPVLAVSLPATAVLSRIVRVETLNVLAQDYVRTARSERLPRRVIYGRHVLPNVATAALTLGGVIFASIIGGAIIVENVFNLPGLGTALVSAVISKDYPVSTGILLVLGAIVVTVNAVIDIAIAYVDPTSLTRRG